MFLGPLVQVMHTTDWWNPSYLSPNSVIHIEDIIFGFTVCGITSTIYDDLGNKTKFKMKQYKSAIYMLMVVLVAFFATFTAFYIFKRSSFYSVMMAYTVICFGMLFLRKDLIIPMFISGLLILVASIPFYYIGLSINPAWITNEWYLSKLSGSLIFGVPIEEFIWFFFTGASFSCVWEALFSYKYSEK